MSVLTRPAQPFTVTGPSSTTPEPSRGRPADQVEHRRIPRAALTLALTALLLASVAGFDRVFVDGAWVGPVVASALAAQVLAAVLRSVRIPPVFAMALGLAGVAVIGVAAALGFGAFASFPGGTWREVVDAVRMARASLATAITPVATSRGYDLLAAWGAGVVALLGDWGAFRLRSPAQGAAPGLALFLLCCVLGGPAQRAADLAGWLAAALIFLLAHQVAMGSGGEVPFAGRRPRSLRKTVAVGTAMGAVSLAVGLAVTPALATRNGHGILGWRDSADSGSTRVVESPIVDLRTRIVKESNVPVFTVRSSVPSYWRLTSLDTFNGTLWTSTNSYETAHDQLPGVTDPPRGTRKVVEEFRIQDLDSIWLPAAFDPDAVTGAGTVTYDPTSGSLLTPHATSNNLVYQVTSFERLATLSGAKLSAAAPLPDRRKLQRYLQLPAGIPSSVVSLARAITAGKTTEYAKALALQDYLLGPSFTYSTDPPTDGYSTSALATFLLDTRTGYCQQFAGAYAVMARIVGIPTRLAVGFATGTQDSTGLYHVTDGDAHTWPEVYFPGYGWVPFEPTKGNFAIPEGDAYTGSRLGDVSPHPTRAAVAGNSGTASAASPAGGSSRLANADAAAGARGHRGRRADLLRPLMLAAGSVVALGLVWPALNLTARRLRWSRRRRRLRRGPGGGVVLAAWQETSERLAWRGVRRRPDETPTEYARRAEVELASDLPPGTAVDDGARFRTKSDRASPADPAALANPGVGGAAEGDPIRATAQAGRDPGETVVGASAVGASAVSASAVGASALGRLADAVTQARYSGRHVPEASTAEALAGSGQLARALWEGAPLRLRLRWWLDPIPAWSAREAGGS